MPPGVYLHDGGEMSSSLGNILGNIATQVGPEGAAKAALLAQQTQGADLANERTWTQQVLDAAAARRANGIMATGGADAQPPGAPGSVAGTVAGLSQAPINVGPGGRLPLVDPSNMSPNDTYMAGRLFSGMSPGDLTTAINLGRTEKLGAGQDYTTQDDIYKAQHMPRDITTGTSVILDPTKGNAPGNVIYGGDPAQLEAQKAQLAADQKDADMRVNLANTARNNQNDLETARQLYRTAGAIGDDDVGAALSDETLKWLSDRSGFNLTRFSKGADVRAAVGAFLKVQLGSVAQQIQGDPNSPMRGVVQQFNAYVPDPSKMSAEQFEWAVDMMEKGQDRLIEEGGPARALQTSNHSLDDFRAYNSALEAIRAKRDAEARADRSGGAGGGGGGGGAGGGKLSPADPGTVARARVKLQQGHNDPGYRQTLIDLGKANGVDLEAGGF